MNKYLWKLHIHCSCMHAWKSFHKKQLFFPFQPFVFLHNLQKYLSCQTDVAESCSISIQPFICNSRIVQSNLVSMRSCKKIETKYIVIVAFCMLLTLFTIQYGSDKNDFLKRQKTKLNFITKYPDIKPEKCLETSPFIGGDFNVQRENQMYHIDIVEPQS